MSEEYQKVWSLVKKILISNCGAQQKRGTAPKNNLERRLEAVLRKLKIILPNNDIENEEDDVEARQ